MEADVAPLFGGPNWTPITPKGGPFCMPIHSNRLNCLPQHLIAERERYEELKMAGFGNIRAKLWQRCRVRRGRGGAEIRLDGS